MMLIMLSNELMTRRAESGMWQSSSSSPLGHWGIVSHLKTRYVTQVVMRMMIHLIALIGKNFPVLFSSVVIFRNIQGFCR